MLLAVDYSGDPGLSEKSSSHLSLAVVACEQDIEVELGRILVALLEESNAPTVRYRGRPAPPSEEFHFSGLEERRCREFMEAIAPVDFTAIVACINKRANTKPSHLGKGNDLLANLIADCVMKLHRDAVDNRVMIVDGGQDIRRLCKQIGLVVRRRLENEGVDYRLAKVVPRKSHRSPVIMVADMLCGAVRQAEMGKAPQQPYLAVLHDKVTVWRIPE